MQLWDSPLSFPGVLQLQSVGLGNRSGKVRDCFLQSKYVQEEEEEEEEDEEEQTDDQEQGLQRMSLGFRKAKPKQVNCMDTGVRNRAHAAHRVQQSGAMQSAAAKQCEGGALQVYPGMERPPPPTRQANGSQENGAGQRLSYAEDAEEQASGSEADEDARRAAVAAKNAAVAALLGPEELADMDDEVERVISHR